jgi:hypothetical protein
MKKWIGAYTLFLVVSLAIVGFSSFTSSSRLDDSSQKIYVQNKCSSDVKIYVTQSGGGSSYTIDHGSTKIMSLDPGQKIYDGNQSKLFYEVTSSSEGKTVVVCQ